MIPVAAEFDACGVHFTWINAISKVGYLALSGEGDDIFVRLWTVAEKAGSFLRSDERVKAQSVGYHYLEKPGWKPKLFVFPRYDGDFSNNNDVYNIAEADTQETTSSNEIIGPITEGLEKYLSGQSL